VRTIVSLISKIRRRLVATIKARRIACATRNIC